MEVALHARHRERPGLAAELRLDRGGSEEVRTIPVGMGRVITFVLVDRVEADVQHERGRRGHGRTIGEVVDADLHATAGTGLGFGDGTEGEEGEKSGTRDARGKET
ncbi:MAG: hypothetical protein EBX95_13205 [Acidimicrobiia bacterium]|nr:hypothetical protein [Acidimicrobiia bacterium]